MFMPKRGAAVVATAGQITHGGLATNGHECALKRGIGEGVRKNRAKHTRTHAVTHLDGVLLLPVSL